MTNTTTPPRVSEQAHQFRKKPVVVEALQFARRNNGPTPYPDWYDDAVTRNDIIIHNTGKWHDPTQPAYCEIKTLEGVMRANEGDWIIRGVKGEIHPCRADIFAETYESATTPAQAEERALFEQYATNQGLRDFERNEFGDYRNSFTQGPWNYWRASRAARTLQAAPEAPAAWIENVIRDVAELPDRDSPADQPDMMLVSAEELRAIIESHAAPVAVPEAAASEHCPHCDDTGDVHRADGEWMGECSCGAAQAAHAGANTERLQAEVERLTALLNTPETLDFINGLQLETAHQRERWSTSHDAGKAPADWFWLIGYLAQKAMMSHLTGDADKALHHTITTAAALANWHAAILGKNDMRPGIAPPVEVAMSATTETEPPCKP